MLVVVVTGMPGSGKSVVARRIAEELGWPLYNMGDIVREEVVRRGLPLTSSNIERVARILREEHGQTAVARLLLDRIDRNAPGAVIDGARSLEEVRVLSSLGPVCVVAVHASPRERFNRVMRRGRRGDAISWEEFVERDLNNIRLGIGPLIALADYMIVNEGSLEEALRQASLVARRVARDEGAGCSGGRY